MARLLSPIPTPPWSPDWKAIHGPPTWDFSAGAGGGGYLVLHVTPSLHHRGLRGFREARRDFWRGAESLEAALIHNAEVPRRRAQEAEEAGAALKTARAGYQGRALDYALQVPAATCLPPRPPGSQGLWPLKAVKVPVHWERALCFQD